MPVYIVLILIPECEAFLIPVPTSNIHECRSNVKVCTFHNAVMAFMQKLLSIMLGAVMEGKAFLSSLNYWKSGPYNTHVNECIPS